MAPVTRHGLNRFGQSAAAGGNGVHRDAVTNARSADARALRVSCACLVRGLCALGPVLINAGAHDIRLRRITGHRKAALNWSKMTHNGHRHPIL
jgi:hypothetical protein